MKYTSITHTHTHHVIRLLMISYRSSASLRGLGASLFRQQGTAHFIQLDCSALAGFGHESQNVLACLAPVCAVTGTNCELPAVAASVCCSDWQPACVQLHPGPSGLGCR